MSDAYGTMAGFPMPVAEDDIRRQMAEALMQYNAPMSTLGHYSNEMPMQFNAPKQYAAEPQPQAPSGFHENLKWMGEAYDNMPSERQVQGPGMNDITNMGAMPDGWIDLRKRMTGRYDPPPIRKPFR